jgi:hypothetical protein
MTRKHERGKDCRADAPADEQSIAVAHLARRERAIFPAEPFGALPVAFAQSF